MADGTTNLRLHSGWLKLELMAHGLRVDPSIIPQHRSTDALFGSSRDLDLVLPGGTWVSVPVQTGPLATSPYTLVGKPGDYFITVNKTPLTSSVPVDVRPPSRLHDHVTRSGIPFRQFGTVHGPYMALSPMHHCTFLTDNDRCGFCGVPPAEAEQSPVSVEDVIEAVQLARDEHPVALVVLSVGHVATEDGGVRFLEPYVTALKKHFDILVAVDALPPGANVWIDRTYGMGADAVSYNLELFDPERFEAVCPGVSRDVGRERFLEALAYAASVFPSGAVTCHLMVGLESMDSTVAGIDALTDLGVMPVLPIYRPFKGRDLRQDPMVQRFAPSGEELGELYAHLYRAVRRNNLNLHLVRDIAVVTTPAEGRFFADADGFWNRVEHGLHGSRFGRRVSAHLSDLRRALRVRAVTPVRRAS